MKSSFIIVLLSICLSSFGQSLDFGIDFKVNQNSYKNYENKHDRPYYSYKYDYLTSKEELNFLAPVSDFSFLDDFGDTVHVNFTNYSISNNIEIPLYVRYNSKHNWFVDFKYSTTKYTQDFSGIIFQNFDYYTGTYGNIDDYIYDYGGLYDSTVVNINGDENYNDTTAFVNWFNNQVEDDVWSQANVRFQEEFKLRSMYLGFGYKFLTHKTIHPYVYAAVGYRSTVKNYHRKYFELDENYLGYSNTKRNLGGISDELTFLVNQMISGRFDFGFELYRYHLGLSYEYSHNTGYSLVDENSLDVLNYRSISAGYHTFSVQLGADLYSLDLNKKNLQKEVYQDEYKTLSSSFDKNRKWSFGFRISTPVYSDMKNYNDFTVIDTKDILDPDNLIVNTNWESLTFRDIIKVNWSPTLHLDYRRNLGNVLDFEISASISRLEVDTEVQEFKTILETDPTDFSLSLSPDYTTVNLASYRSSYFITGLNSNVYYTFWSNGLFDLKAFAGVGLNLISVPYSLLYGTVGVNGDGQDVYDSFNTYYWLESQSSFSETSTWYSGYTEDVDLNQSAQGILDNYNNQNLVPIDESPLKRAYIYGTLSGGVEAELNRLLIGASIDLTLGDVEKVLVKDYTNINLNLGYLLFTKNRMNQQINKSL